MLPAVGCSLFVEKTPIPRVIIQKEVVRVQENAVPGTVNEKWVEPMYDVVEVPGQLDPTGTYYRPPHNTIYEIRPGKFQEVQYPNSPQKKREQSQ